MTRVIVVDDSKVIRNAARKMLGAEFDVVAAEDGEDGWAQIQRDATIQVVDWHGVDPDYLSGFRIDIPARGNEFVVRMNAEGKKAEPAK